MKINTFIQKKNSLHGLSYKNFFGWIGCKELSILLLIGIIPSCSRLSIMQVDPYENQLSESRTEYSQQASVSLDASVQANVVKKNRLFCFDFGGTLVKESLMKELKGCTSDEEKQRAAKAFFDDPAKSWVGGKERIQKLFQEILNNGHHIAITSFGLYPEIVNTYIRGLLSCQEDKDKIFILRCTNEELQENYPKVELITPTPEGKSLYIAVAMDHFKIPISELNRVVFFDDVQRNIDSARRAGINNAILADTQQKFLQDCEHLVTEPLETMYA